MTTARLLITPVDNVDYLRKLVKDSSKSVTINYNWDDEVTVQDRTSDKVCTCLVKHINITDDYLIHNGIPHYVLSMIHEQRETA